MKWKPLLFIGLAALMAIAFGATAILPFAFQRKTAPAGAEADTPAVAPRETAGSAYSPEEIFRRAFWRHPGTEDRIVNAQRTETAGSDQSVKQWQWFLEIEPGPDLLAALRDPDMFGLMLTTSPRFPGDRASAPDWFDPDSDSETLQNPSGGLLLFYNQKENSLFATDAGGGFAPPITSSQTKS